MKLRRLYICFSLVIFFAGINSFLFANDLFLNNHNLNHFFGPSLISSTSYIVDELAKPIEGSFSIYGMIKAMIS